MISLSPCTFSFFSGAKSALDDSFEVSILRIQFAAVFVCVCMYVCVRTLTVDLFLMIVQGAGKSAVLNSLIGHPVLVRTFSKKLISI